MVDAIAHLIAWCQSCVPDAQSAAPAVGIIGGTAGAIGAIGGVAGGSAIDPATPDAADVTSTPGDDAPTAGDDASTTGDDSPDFDLPSKFDDTSGGFTMHEPADPPGFPDDIFHSPSETPQPIFGDGGQVDGHMTPVDDTTETDYINRDGTPLGSTPTAPHHAPGTSSHKPK